MEDTDALISTEYECLAGKDVQIFFSYPRYLGERKTNDKGEIEDGKSVTIWDIAQKKKEKKEIYSSHLPCPKHPVRFTHTSDCMCPTKRVPRTKSESPTNHINWLTLWRAAKPLFTILQHHHHQRHFSHSSFVISLFILLLFSVTFHSNHHNQFQFQVIRRRGERDITEKRGKRVGNTTWHGLVSLALFFSHSIVVVVSSSRDRYHLRMCDKNAK